MQLTVKGLSSVCCTKSSFELHWLGSSIYDVHKKIRFLTPPVPPIHMRPHGPDPPPLWMSTHSRHEIHTALLKWLVQWPTGPKTEIRLYDSNLFKLYY